MHKKPRTISARRIAIIMVVVLLLLLLTAFLYPILPLGGKERINPEKVKDLPPLAELAVKLMNSSSHLAYKSIWSDVDDVQISNIGATAESTLKLLEEVEKVVRATVGGSLGERLLKATYSYENVSSASINASKVAFLLDKVRPDVMLALDLLIQGKVSEALLIWNKIESQVIESRLLLGNSISRLIKIDRSSLLSEAHEVSLNESLARLEELANELDQIIFLFLLVKERPEDIESILEAALSLESGEQLEIDLSELLEKEGVQAAIKAAQNLNPSQAGRFAYQVGRFKALIQLPSACALQGNIPGSGAGREERPDD
ncbi:MAG TPA: hypothetical protein EYP68_07385 [Candidatus Korarchaeota archaeon]|nr:hypothetical protein [Candidatus Korarchaeota archaeon]